MSKRHDALFEDVLKDFSATEPAPEDRGGARFLKRSSTLADTGEREEKVLRWVDPAHCVMWAGHNRAYDLLTAENCGDLIASIKAQGQQEFPAIVRRLTGSQTGAGAEYEVICGARRHFAISWLRANNYPQFRYLIEVRDLTDEEAFRLADLENRDREDISDFERARDYALALESYYGGRQKAMAERLEVSEGWLSRYLQLARLPEEIIAAYPDIREIRELHARTLRPYLGDPQQRAQLIEAAGELAAEQRAAREGQGAPVPAAKVLARLKAAAAGPRKARPPERLFRRVPEESGVAMRRKNGRVTLEFSENLSDAALEVAFRLFLEHRREARK
ncbi:ParB/RepB/Spo0J family partition protein [Plastorhodobacter daqingensis]|uniref:ParB/RepB/Spo0J family partition protein n=1 Tax=Plastorhodobacter daqingensis TaxID=1387281 RepID=A0ABW2ULE0_9RHOB